MPRGSGGTAVLKLLKMPRRTRTQRAAICARLLYKSGHFPDNEDDCLRLSGPTAMKIVLQPPTHTFDGRIWVLFGDTHDSLENMCDAGSKNTCNVQHFLYRLHTTLGPRPPLLDFMVECATVTLPRRKTCFDPVQIEDVDGESIGPLGDLCDWMYPCLENAVPDPKFACQKFLTHNNVRITNVDCRSKQWIQHRSMGTNATTTLQMQIDHLAMHLASTTTMKPGEHHSHIVDILVNQSADHLVSPSVRRSLKRLRAKLLDWYHKHGAPHNAVCEMLRVELQKALLRVGLLALHTTFMKRQLNHVTLLQRRTLLRSAAESTVYSHQNQFSVEFLKSLVAPCPDVDTKDRVNEEAHLHLSLCGAPVVDVYTIVRGIRRWKRAGKTQKVVVVYVGNAHLYSITNHLCALGGSVVYTFEEHNYANPNRCHPVSSQFVI